MKLYIAKKFLSIIPMIIGITFITYLIIYKTPGGPAAVMMDFNPKISQESREAEIKEFGFDKPFHIQYAIWIKKLFKLDFGLSIKDKRPVIEKISERLPNTLLLTVSSLVFTLFLAIPIGVGSALKQNTAWDRGFTLFVFLGFSIPTYWLALLLMILFGIQLGWLPITGLHSINSGEWGWWARTWDVIKHLILPVSVMSLTGLAGLSRYMRNGMLEVIRQDYIRTARAKGLPENIIIWKHAFRNTVIPVVTILGLTLPGLISAGIIFETIFSYPGIGRLAYEAVMSRNTNMIMATVTISAFLTLLGNLIADISYAYVDPRIRVKS